MKHFLFLTLCLLGSYFFSSCSDEWKRDVPDSDSVSRGTLYDVMKERGEYEIFLEGLEKIGYNDLITGKGLSTVFAPNDESMQAWLTANGYSSLDDISRDKLENFLAQHIIHYAYNEDLFTNYPYATLGLAFRHSTFAKDSIFERWDPQNEEYKTVYPMPKYLPVFNKKLFDVQAIRDPEKNYKFFYPNSTWSSEATIYVANALPELSVPTDNGYFYAIDQAIEPMRTIYNVLEDTTLVDDSGQDLSYKIVKEMFDRFPGYQNLTYHEWGLINGDYGVDGITMYPFHFKADGVYSMTNIGSETTNYQLSTQRQVTTFNGFAPNDAAMDDFFSKFFQEVVDRNKYQSWSEVDRLPLFYLLDYLFFDKSDGVVFPELIEDGYISRWGGIYDLDPYGENVNYREFSGNGTFYGLNKVLIPEIFDGPTAPFFRTPSFRTFMYVLNTSGLLETLVNKELTTTILLPNDDNVDNVSLTLDDWTISATKVNVDGVGTLNSATASDYINFLSFNEIITQADWENTNPRWVETKLTDTYLKIGNGRIETELGETVQLGSQAFGDEDGNWTAYELLGAPAFPGNLTMRTADQEGGWYESLDYWWSTRILKKTAHYSSLTSNLVPFEQSKGIIFAGHKDWCRPDYENNNIPPNTDKVKLTAWLDKHILTKINNEDLDVRAFINGDVSDETFKTLDDEFDIIIKKIEATPSDVVLPNDMPVCPQRVTIEIPAQGEEPAKEVYAYGPLIGRDAVCYVIVDKDNRFVWEDEEDEKDEE